MEHSIGEQIRKKRKANFLTMQQLGELLGFSHTYVAKIEKGLATPSYEQIVELARILEMDANYIMLAYNKIPPNIAEILLENQFIIELLEDPDLIIRAKSFYDKRNSNKIIIP